MSDSRDPSGLLYLMGDESLPYTAITHAVAGSPGYYLPEGVANPPNMAWLAANNIIPVPTTTWLVGQFVLTDTSIAGTGDPGMWEIDYYQGAPYPRWQQGPVQAATQYQGSTTGGQATPDPYSTRPINKADLDAKIAGGVNRWPVMDWPAGYYFALQDGTEWWWNNTTWVSGRAVTATTAIAGIPGTFGPAGAPTPATGAGIQALTASPVSPWTAGQYVRAVNADERWWDGSAWRTGRVPALISTVTAQPSGTQATWSGAIAFDGTAIQSGAYYPSPLTAWTSGQWARLGNGDHQRWQGNKWQTIGNGYNPDRLGGNPALKAFSLADIRARSCTGYGTWQVGDCYTPLDGVAGYWNGNYWCKGYSPTPTNLILNLLHDEGSGQFLNDRGPYNTGAWLGGTGNPEGTDPTWYSYGLYFNGDLAGGQWNAGTSADSVWTGHVTCMIVIYFNGVSRYHTMVNKHAGAGSTNNPFEFRTNNYATLQLCLVRSGTSTIVWDGPYLTNAIWMVITVVAGGPADQPIFYVNKTQSLGAYISGTGAQTITGTNSPYYIGRRPDGVCTMNGAMGPLWAWNRMLSQAEVNANYDALKLIMAQRGVTLP